MNTANLKKVLFLYSLISLFVPPFLLINNAQAYKGSAHYDVLMWSGVALVVTAVLAAIAIFTKIKIDE